MASVRGGRTELTDILLSGATIDPDIREDVRQLSSVYCSFSIVYTACIYMYI